MVRRASAMVVCAVAALVLAGCTGSGDPDMPGLTASPSATRTPTPTPSPTSIAGTVVDLSDPELGIVFEDVPDLSGDEADVYNWAATFQVEYWRTMTTNQVSPGMAVIAGPEVQTRMDRMVTNNAGNQLDVGGELAVVIARITVSGDTASAWMCDDFTGATFADPNGEYTPEEMGMDVPIAKTATLTRGAAEGQWIVGLLEDAGSC